MSIRLYITLRKDQSSATEYKKLILMVDGGMKISMLKRRIEAEFSELFPAEPPFICAKIEDEYGYALSNSSAIDDILKNGDRIVGVPEDGGLGFIASNDTHELNMLLNTMQENISGKIADSAVAAHSPVEDLLSNVLSLAFSSNPKTVHNLCMILTKAIHSGNAQMFNDRANAPLLNLLVLALQFWTIELAERDVIVQKGLIEILEVMIKSQVFVANFKTPMLMSKLMAMSKGAGSHARTKLVRIITVLSQGRDAPEYPIASQGPVQHPQVQSTQRQTPQSTYDNDIFSRGDPTRSGPAARQNPSMNQTSDRYNPMMQPGMQTPNRQQPSEHGGSRGGYGQHQSTMDYNQGTRQQSRSDPFQTNLPENELTGIISDYVGMLLPENAPEIISFGLQSLDPILADAIDVIIGHPKLFLMTFNLVDIICHDNVQQMQLNVLKAMTDNLTKSRAEDAIVKNGITRLLKAYTQQPNVFQQTITDFLERLLIKGQNAVDVPALVSVSLCPFTIINELGMKTLATFSDPNSPRPIKDSEFENHINFFIESATSLKNTKAFRNSALQSLSFLALRDYLKIQILYCDGIEMFIKAVRDYDNVEGQRISAKALVNLTSTKRELRLKVVAELSEEIKMLYRNELDSIVGAYIQTLVQPAQ